MHILFLPSWYPETNNDFSGSFFREQAETFVEQGHNVGALVVRGFPVYQLGRFKARNTGIKVTDEHGVKVIRRDALLPFPKLHALNLAVLERRWMQLYKQYVQLHGIPDVMHAHSMLPAGIIASRISKRTGVPFIVTEHRPSSTKLSRSPGYRKASNQAVDTAAALIAVARGFVPELNEAYETEKWEYVPGLLSPQFEHISVRSVPDGPIVIGHISHLDPGKRVALLIEAFHDNFANNPDVELRIVGDSIHKVELEQLTKRLQLTNVKFVGSVPRERIVDAFSGFHVFALTSEKEAFGTVLWEAMACGLPIISTATWAGRNAVTPQTGILVPIDDRVSLAEGLTRLLNNFQHYDPDQIRHYSVDHCGIMSFTGEYLSIYQEAASTT